MRLLVVLLLSLCSLFLLPRAGMSQAATPSRTAPPSAFTLNGLTFRYPSAWHLYPGPKPLTMHSTLIAYLGTMPIGNLCPPLGFSERCLNPITSLPRRGVFVSWTSNSFFGWSIQQIKGKRLTIAGHVAKLQTHHAREGYCAGHTRLSISLTIALNPPNADNWYEMVACLRGPGLAQERKQVMRMVKSVSISEPT